MKGLRAVLRDDTGASAAEYALILSIVGTGIILAAIFLGEAVSGAMSEASTCISTDGASC